MGEGNGTPLQYSCLENPMDGGAWCAAVHGVARSRTRLSNFTFTFHIHALEKEIATHSSVLAWRIPGTGEPGGLPSMGSHRVGHDWGDLAAAAEGMEKTEPSYSIGRNVNCCSHYVKQYEVFQKKKNKAIIWSDNYTLGHICGKDKNSNLKIYMHSNVDCSTIYNRQDVETTQVSINIWLA